MTDDEEFLQHMDTQPLTFGKHKGETPEQIAKHSPGYIRWMYETIKPRVCSAKLNLAVDEAVEKEKARYAARRPTRRSSWSDDFDDPYGDVPF